MPDSRRPLSLRRSSLARARLPAMLLLYGASESANVKDR
jgi:hypothetical protein